MTEITFAGKDGERWEVGEQDVSPGVIGKSRREIYIQRGEMPEGERLAFPAADLDTLIDKLDELRREAGEGDAT